MGMERRQEWIRAKCIFGYFHASVLKGCCPCVGSAVRNIRVASGTSTCWCGSCRPTHHDKRGQANKVSLSCINPHGSFCLCKALRHGRQLQLPYDHLTVERAAQLLHFKIHLQHLQQTALQPVWKSDRTQEAWISRLSWPQRGLESLFREMCGRTPEHKHHFELLQFRFFRKGQHRAEMILMKTRDTAMGVGRWWYCSSSDGQSTSSYARCLIIIVLNTHAQYLVTVFHHFSYTFLVHP